MSSAGESPADVRAAATEARAALSRLRTVNTSFLSNLDYVCALAEQLESTLDQCAAALQAAQCAERKMPPDHLSTGALDTVAAPSEEMEASVHLVSPQLV